MCDSWVDKKKPDMDFVNDLVADRETWPVGDIGVFKK